MVLRTFLDSIGALWSNGLLRCVRISETTVGSDFVLIDLALKLDLCSSLLATKMFVMNA